MELKHLVENTEGIEELEKVISTGMELIQAIADADHWMEKRENFQTIVAILVSVARQDLNKILEDSVRQSQ